MASSDPIRIAMWSGPRNISTALMRSWEARGDTHVWDEPFYAHYLQATGRDHPGREAIIEAYETDWRAVAQRLTGSVPDGRPIFYQKHMAHHVLPGMEGPWLLGLTNAFLIRDPREMLLSLARVTAEPTLADTGLPQQCMLFDYLLSKQDAPAPVIEARDVLEAPKQMLCRLCESIGVAFTERMLSWEAGPRESDGIWAKYWYDSVRASTGFRPYRPTREVLSDRLRAVHSESVPYYDRLYRHRLTP